jgi:metallophosphoesterase superfamily enzyme
MQELRYNSKRARSGEGDMTRRRLFLNAAKGDRKTSIVPALTPQSDAESTGTTFSNQFLHLLIRGRIHG